MRGGVKKKLGMKKRNTARLHEEKVDETVVVDAWWHLVDIRRLFVDTCGSWMWLVYTRSLYFVYFVALILKWQSEMGEQACSDFRKAFDVNVEPPLVQRGVEDTRQDLH